MFVLPEVEKGGRLADLIAVNSADRKVAMPDLISVR